MLLSYNENTSIYKYITSYLHDNTYVPTYLLIMYLLMVSAWEIGGVYESGKIIYL